PTAVKTEDDPVVAEYDVFLTPPTEEQIYLLQYPNRVRSRPYNSKFGATPHAMRIKPNSGFLEMDIKLSTENNFNKYMGLKWGDANKSAQELHNASGTYGPAAGLAPAKPRGPGGRNQAKDKGDRELGIENDLRAFRDAERNDRVHAKQTLGGQLIRHDSEAEAGKPHYFVGAFQGDHLFLTKVDGTAQLRPNFHHLDAEEERARIAVSRAQAEAAGPQPQGPGRTIKQQDESEIDKTTVEYKLGKALRQARTEGWIKMDYIDDEDQIAYDAFEKNLKVVNTVEAPVLKSEMDNDTFLDAVGPQKHGSPTRRRKRQPKKEAVDIEDEDMEDAEAGV
ncbi:hypothetical protein DOTSEDRAFT_136172, partial [Dothistroma septosporum NZE10]